MSELQNKTLNNDVGILRSPINWWLLWILILTSSLSCGSFAGTEETASPGLDESARIDAIFDPLINENTPGFAVMVIMDGNVVHSKGYGLADLGRRTRMSSQTSIRLASLSKQFTAAGIMLLAGKGTLQYDDPASKFIPELKKRYGEKITIRHLLNHTSGLPDYYEDVPNLFPGDRRPMISDGAAVFEKWGKARFAPGDRWEYSNPGYEMLGLIIERVSAMSFPEFMRKEVFDPLEMHHSLVLDKPDVHFKNRAYGFQKSGDSWILHDDNRLNMMFGAGGIYTSLEDLARWDRSLEKGTLIPLSDLNEAFQPAVLNSGEKTDYGFGWRITSYKKNRKIGHGGGWVGFRTFIARFPERRLTVVILGNRGDQDVSKLCDRIVDLFLDE
jgi:CubicO group peptidase (beta-lactamase class C family)